MRELDLTQKPKVVIKDEGHEIFGYCDLPQHCLNPSKQSNQSAKRLILKTDSHMAEDMSIKLKRSLVRKCQNIRIRTDLQSMGIYLVKHWLLKFMLAFEAESEIEFTNFGSEFLSFVAKNQFKQALVKHCPMPSGPEAMRVHQIMEPQQAMVRKDYVTSQVHILPKHSDSFHYLP